jgi:hypothetical protein
MYNFKKSGGKRNIVIINWESEQKSGGHRPKHSVQMMRKMRKDPSNMEGSYHQALSE